MKPVGLPRVLLVVDQLRRAVPGGIGTYVRGLTSGLSSLARSEEIPSVTLYASRARQRPDPLAELAAPLAASRLPGPLMSRAWDAGVLDVPRAFAVVHASSLLTPPGRHASLLVTVHDLAWRRVPEAYPPRGRRWHEQALARALARAEALVVPSAPVAEEIAGEGFDPKAVHVVPHGSDHLPPPDEREAGELLTRLGVEGDFLLSVGTLEPRKNLPRLLEAFGVARSRLPERWPLVVVGPEGWGPRMAEVGPTLDVVPAGTVADATLAALYRRARLLAYVPLLEGFGFPPLEAMAVGTPVLASPMPSTGGAAWDVDPASVEAIADGLTRVATDDVVRARLSERGRKWAGSHTWAASARAHARLWGSFA